MAQKMHNLPLWKDSNSTTHTAKLPWEYVNQEDCFVAFQQEMWDSTGIYCNATWDRILCWPPVVAGTMFSQKCPPLKGVDPSRYAFKKCSIDGRWEGRKIGDFSRPQGWTNYTNCFTLEMKDLLERLYNTSEEEAAMKLQVARGTRFLEIIGLSVSLFSLMLSLGIFSYFRTLHNKRTRIHRNLFVAMTVQVIVRLILYIDQAIVRNEHTQLFPYNRSGIDNTPVLCELFYVLLEYAQTAMFMWMFIEGLYLHNLVAVAFFHSTNLYFAYCILGWGSPIIFTGLWATATALFYQNTQCWWGYSFSSYFWILEGPRMLVIAANLLFLLNIIRILITKLRRTNSSDTLQVRKSVRAAFILLPLLGITNVANLVPSPLHRSVFEFALWSYLTNFLSSWQGFFISLLYCFLNKEVRNTIGKRWKVRSSRRQINHHQRRQRTRSEPLNNNCPSLGIEVIVQDLMSSPVVS